MGFTLWALMKLREVTKLKHISTLFSAKVGTVLVILHEGFVYLCFCLCSSSWFEMGGTQIGDVIYIPAPIRILQYFNQKLMTVGGLFVYGATVNEI